MIGFHGRTFGGVCGSRLCLPEQYVRLVKDSHEDGSIQLN